MPAIYTYEMVNDIEQWDPKYVNNNLTRKEMATMLMNYILYHVISQAFANYMTNDIFGMIESVNGGSSYAYNPTRGLWDQIRPGDAIVFPNELHVAIVIEKKEDRVILRKAISTARSAGAGK